MARQVAEGRKSRVRIIASSLEGHLGPAPTKREDVLASDEVGVATGLAWTESGGDVLFVEATTMKGSGTLILTGHLGEVMKESAQAALSYARTRAIDLGIPDGFFASRDVHIHVPEGAIPKDGPSAGIGMCTALVSSLTKIPVRADVAMTGEITLRGEVLPIGGLKEKLLAAHRGGINVVLIPEENVRDLTDIPKNIKQNLDIQPVRWIDEVLQVALQHMPEPVGEAAEQGGKVVDSPQRETGGKNKPIAPH